MKNNFLKWKVASLALGLICLAGCDKFKDFGDTNSNPYGSVSPINSGLLTDAELLIGNVLVGGTQTGVTSSLYAQQISETQYTEASLYSEPRFEYSITYRDILSNLQVIINRNTNPGTKEASTAYGSNANQIAVAKILQSYIFWQLTDCWGDIPYSQALQGSAYVTPAYDKQEDIYPKLITTLKDAVAKFDIGPLVKGDVFYNGDIVKWKKLANTLQLLISLRMIKAAPAAAQAAFTQAYNHADGYITSNSDNLVITYPGDGTYNNPWFSIYDGRTDYALSKTFGDILTNMNDSRKTVFGSSATTFPYGLKKTDADNFSAANSNYARVLIPALRQKNAPFVFVNAASSLLAVSEGAVRGWVGGPATAKDAYDNAVRASFEQWGLSAADANTVLNNAGNFNSGIGGGNNIGANSVNSVTGQHANTTSFLQRIFLQRYIAHFPDGIQVWSEWRRSCDVAQPNPLTGLAGIPALGPTAFATNSSKGIPRRFVYGTNEYSTNSASVGVAAARLTGGDVAFARTWWDK
ncbi:RagB/SusD family nutrient uptake outer membrane protein [Ferruginibacter profundus]